MFDDDHGVAALRETAQNLHQLVHVGEMEARGGLVQHVDGFSGSAAAQLGGQLDSLGLAAGQGRGRLSQADVGEANVVQCLDLPVDGLHILEEMQRFLHRHVEHIVDAFSFVFDLQRLTVVAFAAADLAGHIDVGEEVHLDLDDAVAAAGLAASAFFVEAEASLVVAFGLGVGGGREQVADQIKRACVGGRVGAGRASDGRLVDGDDLVKLFHAFDGAVFARNGSGAVQLLRQRLVENLVDQGALSRAGDSGDAGHHAQREFYVNIFQIVLRGAAHGQPAGGFPALGGHGDHLSAA